MHTVFALLCFVVVIHWLTFPYPPGLLHWHCGNLTIAPVPAKQPWWIWINTSFEFIINDYITTTKQSTTKPTVCIFLGIYCIYISMSPNTTYPIIGVLCNIGYPPENHLESKSREISFDHNICLNNPIVLKCCTEHCSDTVVLWDKDNWIIGTDLMDERDVARYEFKMGFDGYHILNCIPGSWERGTDIYCDFNI